MQWRFRILKNLDVNTGLHYSGLTLINNHVVEPRFGVKWQTGKHIFAYGLGLHSRVEPLFLYNKNGVTKETANFTFDNGNSFLFAPNECGAANAGSA